MKSNQNFYSMHIGVGNRNIGVIIYFEMALITLDVFFLWTIEYIILNSDVYHNLLLKIFLLATNINEIVFLYTWLLP